MLEARERRLIRAVINPPSHSASGDKSGQAERAEVVRDERLSEAGSFHQLADAELAVDEDLEEPESRFIAEGTKAGCSDGTITIGGNSHPANI